MAMARTKPPDGFSIELTKPTIMPISLEAYWNLFFADDAEFFADTEFVRSDEDILHSSTKWFVPTDEDLKTF